MTASRIAALILGITFFAGTVEARPPRELPVEPRAPVWEVELHPGTFRVHCEKLPHLEPARGAVDYFTVAFHTADNVQYIIVHGTQRPRHAAIKDFLQATPPECTTLAEVRKINGGKAEMTRVLAHNADRFTFSLEEKTRVFFAAERVAWERPDKCEAKGISMLPDWNLWRFNQQQQQTRQLPFRVQWLAEREVFQLAIECQQGDFDFRDWLITVDYLDATHTQEHLLMRNTGLEPPRLGDGYDPIKRAPERVRAPAVFLMPDVRRNAAVQANVSIYELNELDNNLASVEASTNTALAQVVQGELRLQDTMSVFEQHSVFVVQALLVNRTELATETHLRAEAAALPEEMFRHKHGVRMVERIDHGGHIFLVYVFRTRKEDVRRKIISSLQAAYADVTEKASFSSCLEKNGVTTEFTMHTLQDGGDMAPFLNPNLADFRTYLERWVPSVARHPAAVRFFTTPYHNAVAEFPHRWQLGFGRAFTK